MIRIQGLKKYFNEGKSNEIRAVDGITLDLPEKGMVAIFGKSGCGKTTLLNLIGGLDSFSEGALTLEGQSITEDTDGLRNRYIGYIFQNYNLCKDRTCYENVADALRLCGVTDEEQIQSRVFAALAGVDMEKYASRTPDTLSGGQQQRIAIARAIVKNPRIILADEPTGNLDEANTVMIMDLLRGIANDHLVLLVTHEEKLVDFYCDRVIVLSDGKVTSVRENENAGGYEAKDKHAIFLGDLPYETAEGAGAEIAYYGERPRSPIRITLVSHGGKTYLRLDSPEVQVLDETSEIRLIDGVYKEKARQGESKSFDAETLSPLPESDRYGRLFTMRSSVKSGYRTAFHSGKRSARALRRCLSLFAAVIVFMSAIFGSGFKQLIEAGDAYNHNVFYVFTPNGETSDTLLSALGKAESGIDHLHLLRYFPSGDDTVSFRAGSFESFEYYGTEALETNAVYLSFALTKDMKLVAGRREGLDEQEMLITTAVADALLEKSPFGYITEYKDLCGLISEGFTVDGRSFSVAGVVESDESAVYVSEMALARRVQDVRSTVFYALASDFKMTVKSGEALLFVSSAGTAALPERGESVKLLGKDFSVSEVTHLVQYYADYLTEQGIEKPTSEAFFTALTKQLHPTLTEGSVDFKAALTTVTDEHYYEYYDLYYEHYDAFYQTLGLFLDRIEPWLYFEKGIVAARYYSMPEDYFKAVTYKEQNGAYPSKTVLTACKDDLASADDLVLEALSLYEDEYYAKRPKQLPYSVTYLVSDEDYLTLSRRVGKTHASASYGGDGEYHGDADSIDFDNLHYTVIHSANPSATEAFLEKELGTLAAPGDYHQAIYTPDAVRAGVMQEISGDILGNLVALAVLLVLMSVCMYFFMRAALMNRIREVGIFRAIGVSRKNLLFRFFVESAVLTTLTAFVGYLLTSLFITLCLGASPLVESILYYPIWMAGGVLILLYLVSLFFGTLPILMLLRKTPSEILAKYDI